MICLSALVVYVLSAAIERAVHLCVKVCAVLLLAVSGERFLLKRYGVGRNPHFGLYHRAYGLAIVLLLFWAVGVDIPHVSVERYHVSLYLLACHVLCQGQIVGVVAVGPCVLVFPCV